MVLWLALAALYLVLLTVVLLFMAGASYLNEKADQQMDAFCRDHSASDWNCAA